MCVVYYDWYYLNEFFLCYYTVSAWNLIFDLGGSFSIVNIIIE